MAAWARWQHRLTEVEARIATLSIAVVAIAYTAEVAARHFFDAPLNWSGDLSSYLLCACVFLALPKITSDGAHIAVTYFQERMRGEAKRRYARGLSIVTGCVCLMAAWFIAEEGWRQFNSGVLTSQANQIPKWWLSALGGYSFVRASLYLIFSEPGTDRQSSEDEIGI